MSKPFDYSKWDNIELSDDEDDVHPNIDKESWFRLKHRSRVEREDNEEKDKKKIMQEMEKANQRIKVLQHDLAKLEAAQKEEDSDDDDELDDRDALKTEIDELQKANKARQEKLDAYEKNKKWNVDNICQVKEERTVVNPEAGKANFTPTGFAQPKDVEPPVKPKAKSDDTAAAAGKDQPKKINVFEATQKKKPSVASEPETKKPEAEKKVSSNVKDHNPPPVDLGAFETYAEFTEKYAETVELFMRIPDLEGSKEFLLKYGDILLQENASNYLLLASLEDEMNGHHEKMKRTARQSQIISHIAELAKTLNTHPGNVITPFFQRLQIREHLEEFLAAVKAFQEKIVARAIVKKREIDEARAAEEPKSLEEIPLEERLGPGGLDPVEVIKTLPDTLVKAFESRDVQQLQEALMQMDPADAEYHMKRCVDSGLWLANK